MPQPFQSDAFKSVQLFFFLDDQVDFQLIVDHIRSLPTLLHCTLGIGIKGHSFRLPTRISSSLQSVSIEKVPIELNQITRLVEQTPGLTRLSISVLSFVDNDYTPSALPTLTELSISSLVTCNASSMAVLLQNTLNLRQLNIDLLTELVDGNQWKEIIRAHLSNLEVFQLRMKVILPATANIQGRVDALMVSFQTRSGSMNVNGLFTDSRRIERFTSTLHRSTTMEIFPSSSDRPITSMTNGIFIGR